MSESQGLLIVTTSYPMGEMRGGEAAGSFVADLAEELSRRVHVRVVAPGSGVERETPTQALEVFRFPAPGKPLSTLKPWNPADLFWILRVLSAGEEVTRRAVADGRVSHILALWALPSGHWARRASLRTGIPYSVWTLGSDIWTLARVPLVRTHLRQVLRDARRCYSDGIKLAEETRKVADRDVAFLPSTRRIGGEQAPPVRILAPYRLLFLGRWHRNKGVDLLLDALGMLDAADWQRIESIEIQGGGPLAPLVRSRVQAFREAGHPVVVGRFLSKVEAEQAIVRSAYVLIPSRIESVPVVFSDAMKLGRPVVAAPVGDLPDLVGTGEPCGVLAGDVSAAAFARALRTALATSPETFAAGVSRQADAFDLAGVAATILAGL
jgi:glycosyltransferase involved in cell wall biosynthesis